MLLGVMLNEKLKVAVENVCIQKQLLEGKILTDFTQSGFCQRILSLNNNHAVVNTPHAFGGSPRSAHLRLCSHLGRKKEVTHSDDSFMCLKQSDSQPGLQHCFCIDTHLSRCNSICLMPEDS